MRPNTRFIAALVGALVLVVTSARADEPKEDAKKHYTLGLKLYNLGDYSKAQGEFRAAYLAVEDPVFLFNIGQCARMLGDPDEAARSYHAYLRERPKAPNRREVEKFIAAAEHEIETRRSAAAASPTATLPPGADTTKPVTEGPPTTENTPPVTTITPQPQLQPEPLAAAPVYKRWWFWTIIGGAAVITIASVVAAFFIPDNASIPGTTFGNTEVHF